MYPIALMPDVYSFLLLIHPDGSYLRCVWRAVHSAEAAIDQTQHWRARMICVLDKIAKSSSARHFLAQSSRKIICLRKDSLFRHSLRRIESCRYLSFWRTKCSEKITRSKELSGKWPKVHYSCHHVKRFRVRRSFIIGDDFRVLSRGWTGGSKHMSSAALVTSWNNLANDDTLWDTAEAARTRKRQTEGQVTGVLEGSFGKRVSSDWCVAELVTGTIWTPTKKQDQVPGCLHERAEHMLLFLHFPRPLKQR